MTLRIAKEVQCDECYRSERLDGLSLRQEWPVLRKEGWSRSQGLHYCPDCTAERKKPKAERVLP